VPASGIVANFNMDMFLSLYPALDVIAFGPSATSVRWRRKWPAAWACGQSDPF
jgi:hypothetical protein